MKKFASATHSQTDLMLKMKPLSVKVVEATLKLSLSCVFLKEGKATWVHCFINWFNHVGIWPQHVKLVTGSKLNCRKSMENIGKTKDDPFLDPWIFRVSLNLTSKAAGSLMLNIGVGFPDMWRSRNRAEFSKTVLQTLKSQSEPVILCCLNLHWGEVMQENFVLKFH